MIRFAVAVIALLFLIANANAQSFPGYGPSGGLYIGQGNSALPSWSPLTGDCTLSSGGGIVCIKTNGVNLGTMATQNANTVAIVGGTINGATVTGLPSPSGGTDAATKTYVDNTAVGLTPHTQGRLATAAALPTNTYANGTAGVGATLTATAPAALTVDGVAVATSDRIVVKNEAAPANNGIYTVTNAGSGGAAYILTRATDANQPGTVNPNLIGLGTFIFVTAGTANGNTGWTVNSTVTTIGTSAINWTQFSGGTGVASINSTNGSFTTNNGIITSGSQLGLSVGAFLTFSGASVVGRPFQFFVITSTNATWNIASNFGYVPSELIIEAWGGGASGAGRNGTSNTSRGAGGGSGQYFFDHYVGTMDTTLNITIGGGGTATGDGSGGNNGGNSSVVGSNLGTLTAHGGLAPGCSGANCAGGVGGSGATGATYGINGGDGGATFGLATQFGSGGNSPRGGGAASNVAENGYAPAGGGSGQNHTGGVSGAGAQGWVIISGR